MSVIWCLILEIGQLLKTHTYPLPRTQNTLIGVGSAEIEGIDIEAVGRALHEN